MSAYNRDKCSKQEIQDFKKVVIKWLQDYGINTEVLDIRAYTSYGGDIKIFTGDKMEYVSDRVSHRRTETVKDTTGKITGYYRTTGHHTIILNCPILINRDEWEFFKKSVTGEDKECWDDYHKLEKLKNSKGKN